ncbi:PDR/VanB family oxidoreductase [Gordonia sp. CPCC 205515]|uniref:PDR/VanB family oxidoreductase n=1 Tax=Gordonia sp. CPCC 205515 TaxID=3140791 RepID=UPI003AF337CB
MNARKSVFGRRPAPEHLYGAQRVDYSMVSTRWLLGAWMPIWERVLRYEMRKPESSTIDVAVVERTSVAADGSVVELAFAPHHPEDTLPDWTAGAHLRLMLPSGRIREYSLCGHPGDTAAYRIAVRRLSADGASAEVHTLQVGDVVRITRPLNAFPLALPGHGSAARHLHFIAGGIGITPILPMIETAERFGVSWSLTYLSRTVASAAYRDRLAAYGDRVHLRTDDVHGLPSAADLVADIRPDAAVYFCGPPVLTDGLLAELEKTSTGAEVHFERFGIPVTGGREFTVVLGSSGQRTQVGADESMLHAVAREIPSVTYSCRQGFCGTCKVRVLDGEVDHADSVLTDHERADGYMLPCVSRAASESLVIDL